MTNLDIISKVKSELLYTIDDMLLQHYVEKGLAFASNIACYKVDDLPDTLKYYVIDAVVEALNKRGSEEKNSENALGVSATFTFKDMEESLRHKLRNKKNPKSLRGYY